MDMAVSCSHCCPQISAKKTKIIAKVSLSFLFHEIFQQNRGVQRQDCVSVVHDGCSERMNPEVQLASFISRFFHGEQG
jgi:hypothetical protein